MKKNIFPLLALWTITASSVAFANPVAADQMVQVLAEGLQPCQMLEFAKGGGLNELGASSQILTAAWLDVVEGSVRGGIPRPQTKDSRLNFEKTFHRTMDAKNEQLYPFWPMNPVFRGQVRRLADTLRQDPYIQITIGQLMAATDAWLQEQRKNNLIGECYKISQVTGTFNSEWIEMITLSPEAQTKIDGFFKNPLNNSLTATETLTVGELAELQAIRRATQVFEEESILRKDIGGFPGNLDFLGRIRSVCRTEAQTYYFFLKRLQQRGLLRHFTASETWAYRKKPAALDGHAAAILQSRRTGQLLVVDSWHENGGAPAHITLFQDWVQEKDRADVVGAE